MRVLFVNHTSHVSGAERSLLELLELLHEEAEVALACPEGDLMQRAQAIGVETIALHPPQIGFSAGPRALIPALVGVGRTGLKVRALARRHQADIVHAASPRAGLLTASCVFSRSRRVVDVRDVLPPGVKAASVRWLLRLSANVIVFNSKFTRDRFGPTRPARAVVIHPAVDIQQLLTLPLPSPGSTPIAPLLGVVGQITPWKGQDDAIRILALVRKRHPGSRLRIVGSVVFSGSSVSFDNEAFSRRLPLLAAELGVAEAVELAGEIEDPEVVFGALDVLLVPSWEEPFGRVVVEGMAAGVPVIATRVGGPSEVVEDSVTGFLATPQNPEAWVEPVTRLLESSELAQRISEAARERVRATFGDKAESFARVRALYDAEISTADRGNGSSTPVSAPTQPTRR